MVSVLGFDDHFEFGACSFLFLSPSLGLSTGLNSWTQILSVSVYELDEDEDNLGRLKCVMGMLFAVSMYIPRSVYSS